MLADELKKTTAQVHDQLEKRIDILSHLETIDLYKNLLIKFYQFYLPIEEQLQKYGNALPLEGRIKLHFLKNDLLAIGMTPEQITRLPKADPLPSLCTLAEAVGAFYVLEGSTLGGQVISKHLRQKLGILPEKGGGFFWAYGENTMPMWLKFKDFLNTYEGDHGKALESAKNTFLALENWLCELNNS